MSPESWTLEVSAPLCVRWQSTGRTYRYRIFPEHDLCLAANAADAAGHGGADGAAAGSLAPHDLVLLSAAYEQYGAASEGPLAPGVLGTVARTPIIPIPIPIPIPSPIPIPAPAAQVEIDDAGVPVCVRAPGGERWYYAYGALKAAVAYCAWGDGGHLGCLQASAAGMPSARPPLPRMRV